MLVVDILYDLLFTGESVFYMVMNDAIAVTSMFMCIKNMEIPNNNCFKHSKIIGLYPLTGEKV